MPQRLPREPVGELVYDQTFVARKHAHLLRADDLVDDAGVRALQVLYRDERSPHERQRLALAFEKAVRGDRRGLADLDEDFADQLCDATPRVVRTENPALSETSKCFFSSSCHFFTSGFVQLPTIRAMREWDSPSRYKEAAVTSSMKPSKAEMLISTTAGAIAAALPEWPGVPGWSAISLSGMERAFLYRLTAS